MALIFRINSAYLPLMSLRLCSELPDFTALLHRIRSALSAMQTWSSLNRPSACRYVVQTCHRSKYDHCSISSGLYLWTGFFGGLLMMFFTFPFPSLPLFLITKN